MTQAFCIEVNHDLKNIVEWLRANRIALNTNKTNIALFRSPRKIVTRKMNFRISGQRIKIKHCKIFRTSNR